MVGWECDVVFGRFVRIPIDEHDLDRAFSDFVLNCHTFGPLLGSWLLRDHLAAMDSGLDSLSRADGPWRHRIVFRDGNFWLHDDRSQHRICPTGPCSTLGWDGSTT